ncbi:MAG: 1-acyl-sn-glycerol-3-phosphate acyltransferase, partial [Ewingella sp.]|nr:1-acyl-sn-glycerol-3-phosphate acyltransferase [Ewingella sp.]
LPPVDTSQYGKERLRDLSNHCHQIMADKIAELDAEVAQREAAAKAKK